MNREEAKELLIHILMTYEPKDQYGDYDDPEPYEQAITMAIEALSQPIVCKDFCIDDDHIYCSPKVAARVVEALSRTGEWIVHEWAEECDGLLISNYECTNCHSWERNNTDFCPNCGAYMRGEDKESEVEE